MELAWDEWGLNDQLARSAAAAEAARRSKARSLRSESDVEGPAPSDKMVDELEEGELPPTLQEAPAPVDRKSYPVFPFPMVANPTPFFLRLAPAPPPPSSSISKRPVEVIVELVSNRLSSLV